MRPHEASHAIPLGSNQLSRDPRSLFCAYPDLSPVRFLADLPPTPYCRGVKGPGFRFTDVSGHERDPYSRRMRGGREAFDLPPSSASRRWRGCKSRRLWTDGKADDVCMGSGPTPPASSLTAASARRRSRAHAHQQRWRRRNLGRDRRQHGRGALPQQHRASVAAQRGTLRGRRSCCAR